ncbi:membrane or secreted protein containing DUF1791 [Rhodopirellula maiorica SM1]|uniref:Membrane or secreted protein containing DUF1791 n=1 Tax=Rhodopirellula maiorica SM1 TaxID=1265738 RepID=M5RML5_9BACT|nr:DsrE family protein [Rhodopirellula maiorica]EMI20568.1 membrane or secreted protein containing DUF1791 [Rhodopirellula maiorica SM1]
MNHPMTLFTVLFFGVLAITPASAPAQDPPGQRRGMGLGGGRGAGFGGGRGRRLGQGRGLRHQAAANEKKGGSHELAYPVIADHGGVVRLPDAAQQPRAATKFLVDLTSGNGTGKLNAGFEKVAKYVNIYAGGGADPVDVEIAVVVHGDATLAVLNADAYAAKFKTEGNPNLKLLRELHGAGVEFYVCGQTLIAKGATPDDVADFVKTAVSALTAVVNLQADGFAYVPITHASSTPSLDPQAMVAKDVNTLAEEDHTQESVPGAAMGHGPGAGRGIGARQGMQGDMTTLHAMFADRDKINRTVTNLPDGAEAVTESDDQAIATMLKEHVPAMEDRVLGDNPLPPMTFHPIFVELIKHADDYTLSYEETEKGMKVKYQSDDPYVVMLVQEHAKLVSRFIKNGMEEIHTPYTLPNFPKETNE